MKPNRIKINLNKLFNEMDTIFRYSPEDIIINYTTTEFKIALKKEPFNLLTISRIKILLIWVIENEYYEYAAIIRDYLNKI